MSTQLSTPAADRTHASSSGTLCLVGGLVGVTQAITILLVPAQVGVDRFSYPFTATGYAVAQFTFFLQHLLLLPALVTLTRWSAVRRSGAARLAAGGALVGMGLLALLEVVAIAAWHEPTSSALATTITNAYGVPVTLIGAALSLLGALLLRDHRRRSTTGTRPGGTGPLAWTVLALGLYVFVPLTPSIMGSFVAGRLGIGGWMALFAVLGLLLRHAVRHLRLIEPPNTPDLRALQTFEPLQPPPTEEDR